MAANRLSAYRQEMADRGLSGMIVTQPENRRYMSGFTGSAGALIITMDRALILTDFRYYTQVAAQAPAFELVKIETAQAKVLASALRDLGLDSVGFESGHVTVQEWHQWREASPETEWKPVTGLVEKLRVVKDADEIAKLEQAVKIGDEAMMQLMQDIHPGMTEKQVAWDLEAHMRNHGASGLSFTTIVASGPNGALPHAVTTDRVIERGDGVVIDMGCVYEGYCSDMTRSFCVGEPDERYELVWKTVLDAQLACESALKPGMTGVEADAIARDLIYGAGFEGKFGHGLGHGVGLAIHEPPRASYTSTDTLLEGMIVTVEPGIYEPGWGGVRTEDMVVMTADGCRVLTQTPKPMAIDNA